MTKLFALTAVALMASSSTAFAGDAAAGEADFNKCKSCHMIADGSTDIVKGGKTGPNLFGIVGRTAGSYEGFKYGDSIVAAGEAGLIWTEALIVEYVADPKAFLSDQLGEAAKSKMTFKLKDGSDIAAYLATF